jgi:PEP-CTERM putative exosortase interaction domain
MKRFLIALAAFALPFVATSAPKLQIVGEQLTAVSADGRYVVGTTNNQGFRYSVKTGAYDWLPFTPTDINGDGSVIVGRDTVNRSVARWDNGTTTLLQNLPFPEQRVFIAAHADVIASVHTQGIAPDAFVWSDNTLTSVPLPAYGATWVRSITTDGAVHINIYPSDSGDVSILFKDGVITYPAADYNFGGVYSVSDDGAAFSGFSYDLFRSVIVNANGLQDSHYPNAPGFVADTFNFEGTIAGGYYTAAPEFTLAAVWSESAGAFPLSALVNLPPLWRLDDVLDMSHDGRVLIGNAYGGPDSEFAGYIVTDLYSLRPIPEPSTYGASAAALLVALVLVRRNRRRIAHVPQNVR